MRRHEPQWHVHGPGHLCLFPARLIKESIRFTLICVSGKIEAEGTFIRADFVGERGSIVLAAVFP